MLQIFFLFTFHLFSIYTVSGSGYAKLAIYDNNGDFLNKTYISKNVNDTLILVCKIKLDNVLKYTPNLTWILPTPKNRPLNAIRPHTVQKNEMSIRLVVDNLQESDHGQYQCIDKNKDDASICINLIIIRRAADCGKGVFCDNHCILERFKCDGVADCKNGKDESFLHCGHRPCQDKIMCENGRCIPQSWCCNSSIENCTTKWDIMCCPKIRGSMPNDLNTMAGIHGFNNPDIVFREYSDRPVNYLNNPQHYSDLNFLQATVYTVFGCAILLMLIVTILVVVMQCRLQIRRNLQFQLLNRQRVYGNNTYHRPLNQEVDLMDMVVERYNQRSANSGHQQQQSRNHQGGLLVTYNINNGVQIVGKPVEPPPYCEVAPNPPAEQGPPPPYLPISSEEGENSNTTSPKRNSGRKERRGLSKVQASSEPTLSNI